MADRWAFVVAVEKPLDPALGATPYAEAGAKALAEALTAAGYPKANQLVLLGQHATKAAVESRLRKLKKAVRKGDEVVVFWAGRGAIVGEYSRLVCWDTLPDDMPETSLAFADLFAAVDGSKAGQAVFLLDVGGGPGIGMHIGYMSDQELETTFSESAKSVGLSSTPSEPSLVVGKLSAWVQLVLDALGGRALKAVDEEGRVTALSLQRHIDDELPRLLRKHFEAGTTQTPQLYGQQNAAAVVADLMHLLGSADGSLLDPERLKRVLFRSDGFGRVKDLTGWRKTFDMPETARPSAKKFVARIANADAKADLDQVFEACREHLGYKRKDVEVTTGPDGFGVVRTPDFEYTVTATLDAEDPTRVAWRREVGQFADPGFVRSDGFDAVFGKLFDQLVFEFAAPVDVAALVDRLEDRPPKGAKVQVASDGGSCDISLGGFVGRVTVDRHYLTVRGRAGDSAGLLDQFLAFLKAVGPLGESLALPPAH